MVTETMKLKDACPWRKNYEPRQHIKKQRHYFADKDLSSQSFVFSRRASLVAQLVRNPPAMWETWVRSLGWEDPLEKGKAVHSSILAWTIPWIVKSTGSQRVGHD